VKRKAGQKTKYERRMQRRGSRVLSVRGMRDSRGDLEGVASHSEMMELKELDRAQRRREAAR